MGNPKVLLERLPLVKGCINAFRVLAVRHLCPFRNDVLSRKRPLGKGPNIKYMIETIIHIQLELLVDMCQTSS